VFADPIFKLLGSNLATSRALTSGDDGVHTQQVCATQNGTQICQNITVTVSASGGGGGGLPQDVINAGFTTQMFAFDFTSPSNNNLPAYVDACGASGGNIIWRWNIAFSGNAPCARLEITTDQSSQVLHMHANSSEDLVMTNPIPLNGGSFISAFPLLSYSEVTFRIDGASFNDSTSKGTMFDFWNGPAMNPQASGFNSSPYFEPDSVEVNAGDQNQSSGVNTLARGQILMWQNGSPVDAPGFDVRANWSGQYNTVGFLMTSDSIGGTLSACVYLNGSKVGCNTRSGYGSAQYRHDYITIMTINACHNFNCGGTGGSAVPTDVYVKNVRKFSCSNWQSSDCTGPVIQ
jgi:hypothetical protein